MSHELSPATFVAESRDLLHDMEEALLALEHTGHEEAVNAAFRAMHTIKGSAGVFGFDAIVEFAHAMEEVIVELRLGRLAPDDQLVALLLGCRDHVARMIDSLESGDRLERLEALRCTGGELLQQLACYSAERPEPIGADGAEGADDGVKSACWHVSLRFGPDVLRHGMDPLSFLRYLSTLGRVRAVTPVFDAMPEAQPMDPETCYAGLELQFAGEVTRQVLEDVFEFVRDGSSVRVVPPHASLTEWAALVTALAEDRQRLGSRLVEVGALTPGEWEAACALAGTEQGQANGVAARQPSAQRPSTAAESQQRKAGDGRAVRVHAAKLDDLIDLVGELVIASAGASLCARRVADADLREATSSMSRLVEEVRDAALSLRMVPAGESFSRFKRVVHDLGRELGKEVDLVISGADTELDKSMVEKLSDPLMHLVRNALDHGIESPAERIASGKPARGTLRLDARHESGSIVISVGDDGAGLDAERIRTRAIERGLLQAGDTIGKRELLQLVMEPGFSTAAEVTSVSGRGMGMDVVRRNLEGLRGSVAIDSVPGQGTCVALRAPLTLAIIDGFLVGVGTATFVLPLEMVVECLELDAESRGSGAAGYVSLRGEVLPLLRLRHVFDAAGQPSRRENIVVVQYAGRQAGLVVDTLMGEFQTVIKPLGRVFERLAGISGSTILGTGEVALILDTPALVERAVRQEIETTTAAAGAIPARIYPPAPAAAQRQDHGAA